MRTHSAAPVMKTARQSARQVKQLANQAHRAQAAYIMATGRGPHAHPTPGTLDLFHLHIGLYETVWLYDNDCPLSLCCNE